MIRAAACQVRSRRGELPVVAPIGGCDGHPSSRRARERRKRKEPGHGSDLWMAKGLTKLSKASPARTTSLVPWPVRGIPGMSRPSPTGAMPSRLRWTCATDPGIRYWLWVHPACDGPGLASPCDADRGVDSFTSGLQTLEGTTGPHRSRHRAGRICARSGSISMPYWSAITTTCRPTRLRSYAQRQTVLVGHCAVVISEIAGTRPGSIDECSRGRSHGPEAVCQGPARFGST